MRHLLFITLLVLLAFAPVSSPAAEPFEINAILSLTGAGSFVGKAEQIALGALETTLNAGGGLDGRPVKFVIADDQSNAQVAVQLGSALLAKGVTVILGPTLVAPCQALAPLVKGRAIEFCLSAGFHPERDSYGFVAGVSTLQQLVFSVHYLRQAGLHKIASLTSLDANGQDADHGIEMALARPENRDVSLVAALHFNLADLTVAAQMARIKASGADALINYNTGTPFGTVLHGMSDVGLDVPLVTQPAALNFATMAQYASLLPKRLLITGQIGDAPDVAPRGATRTALATYLQAFKAIGVVPDHTNALIWDPAMIVVTAYRKLGTGANGTQLNDFIQNLHGWAGINGEYDFRTAQSGLSPGSLVMVQWNPNKKTFVPVSRPGGGPLPSRE